MQPITSIEAYHSLDHDSIDTLHAKILETLAVIKVGTSGWIAVKGNIQLW